MRLRLSLKSFFVSLALIVACFLIGGFSAGDHTPVKASQADAYDLSEWQGRINDHAARGLKREVSFVILRAQYGNNYQDRQFQNSINEMTKHNIPYGVYSYSLYHNNRQARNEAASLYGRAPQANFYVNDIEQNNAGHRIVSATNAWAKEMKRLTTRPIVLYSYSNFINGNLRKSRKHYDAVWLASYSKQRPVTGYKYDLWQYTSKHYSKALGKKIDASKITGDKPLSFWIGRSGNTAVVKPVQSVTTVKPPKVNGAKKAHRNDFKLSHHELRKYHHELRKIGRKLRRGHHHMTRAERKALKIYQIRHGRAFQL